MKFMITNYYQCILSPDDGAIYIFSITLFIVRRVLLQRIFDTPRKKRKTLFKRGLTHVCTTEC